MNDKDKLPIESAATQATRPDRTALVVSGLTDSNQHHWPRLSEGDEPGIHDMCARCGKSGFQALGVVCLGMVVPDLPRLTDFERQWNSFEEFARTTFESDLKRAREKAMEYGSHDLEIMGTSMEALLPEGGLLDPQSRHSAGIEMAIAFYLTGKAARMFGAYKKGTTPGDDSWRDGNIYSMMARYVRVHGRWIG